MSREMSLALPCFAPPVFPDAGRLQLSEMQINGNYKKQIREEIDNRASLAEDIGKKGIVPCCRSLHISLFFDGTGNNEENDTRIAKPSHPTNIAKLYHATYQNADGEGYFRYYIPGVGTPFPKIGEMDYSNDGLAFAAGGEDRINWALLRLVDALTYAITKGAKRLDDGLAKGMLPSMQARGAFSGEVNRRNVINPLLKTLESQAAQTQQPHLLGIKLFIYGFSRGAAEARTFVNWLTQLPDPKLKGDHLKLAGLPISIEFLGLLDTVASVGAAHMMPGAAGHMGWADNSQQLPDERKFPGLIKCCRHFVAAHEQRLCFPLDSVRRPDDSYPANTQEVIYPGMHSDVGGGYPPGDQGKSCNGTGELLSQIVLHDIYVAAFEAGAPLAVLPKSISALIKDVSPSRAMSPESQGEFDFSKTLVRRFNIWRQTLLSTTLQGSKEAGDTSEGYRAYQLSQTLESALIDQIGWITAWRIGRYAHGSMLPQGDDFANSFFNKAPQLTPEGLKKEADDHKAAVKALDSRRAEAQKSRLPLDESLQGKPDLDPTNSQYQLREAAREFQHDYKDWGRDINGNWWDKTKQIALDVIPKHAVFLINGDDEKAEYEQMKADGDRRYPKLFIDKLGTGIRTQPRADLLALYDEQIHDSRAWFMQSALAGREPWGGYFRYRMLYCGNQTNKNLRLISVEGKVINAAPTSNNVIYFIEPKTAYSNVTYKVKDMATGVVQTLTPPRATTHPGTAVALARTSVVSEQHQAMMTSAIDMLKSSGARVV
ncbi:T6SS phospholipase effector Tle1-like catalytic domain-containing protein [Enterobacter ludwigii]